MRKHYTNGDTIIHSLKIKERYLNRLLTRQKTFEVRLNDRDYQVGDIIIFSADKITETISPHEPPYEQKHSWEFEIKYICSLRDFIPEVRIDCVTDYVVLGVEMQRQYQEPWEK